jgi:hypothetical protein
MYEYLVSLHISGMCIVEFIFSKNKAAISEWPAARRRYPILMCRKRLCPITLALHKGKILLPIVRPDRQTDFQ